MAEHPSIDIGVGILSFNRPEFLREAVISVLQQDIRPTSISIFDNGSAPTVKASIQDLLDELEWIGSASANGFYWNFERAVRSARSAYTLLLHDDDRLCRDFLRVQSQYLLAHPEIDVLSSNGYTIDASGVRAGGLVLSAFDSDTLWCASGADVGRVYSNSRCVPFSPAIYRTEALQRVPLRPEYSKVIDAVLFCDLADNGPVVVNMMPLYECRIHPRQDSSSFDPRLRRALDAFFWERPTGSQAERQALRREIATGGAQRVLGEVMTALKSYDLRSATRIAVQGWSQMYSLGAAAKYVARLLANRARKKPSGTTL
jgi:glycosyltransferase involved in cell wall biosynthesis